MTNTLDNPIRVDTDGTATYIVDDEFGIIEGATETKEATKSTLPKPPTN